MSVIRFALSIPVFVAVAAYAYPKHRRDLKLGEKLRKIEPKPLDYDPNGPFQGFYERN